MTSRNRIEELILGPRVLRGKFILALVVSWVAALVVAAVILTMQIGSPITPLFVFFFWPSCIGDGCLNAGLTRAVIVWLTFLAWAVARLGLWLSRKFG